MELLQIATAQFITKCDGLLLQIATSFLLQIATGITKCNGFFTKATGITKCDDYYELRQYTWTYDDEFSSLFLNLNKILENSTPGKVACI